MNPFAIGSAFVGLAVVLGAFAAHALKTKLDPAMQAVFETAVKYQMYHGLGLMILAQTKFATTKIVQALTFGTIIFSGSLYALTITNLKWFGAITPIGGTLMIIGWVMVTYRALKN